jgi:hypothetical protein
MNFKTILTIFCLLSLVSCASGEINDKKDDERILYPENGRSCCD